MGTWTGSCAALLLTLALAACNGSEQGPEPEPSLGTATATPTTASGSMSALSWPEPPTSALPTDNAAAMLAEMQRWIDAGFLSGATAAVVSPLGVCSQARRAHPGTVIERAPARERVVAGPRSASGEVSHPFAARDGGTQDLGGRSA